MKSNYNNILVLFIILIILTFFQLNIKESYQNFEQEQEEQEEGIYIYETPSLTCPEEDQNCIFSNSIVNTDNTTSDPALDIPVYNKEDDTQSNDTQYIVQNNPEYTKAGDLKKAISLTLDSIKSMENNADRTKIELEEKTKNLENAKTDLSKDLSAIVKQAVNLQSKISK